MACSPDLTTSQICPMFVSKSLRSHEFGTSKLAMFGVFAMLLHSCGPCHIPTYRGRRVVIDFTLVDFQAMFKFIDIEEVRHTRIDSYQLWKNGKKTRWWKASGIVFVYEIQDHDIQISWCRYVLGLGYDYLILHPILLISCLHVINNIIQYLNREKKMSQYFRRS